MRLPCFRNAFLYNTRKITIFAIQKQKLKPQNKVTDGIEN